MCNSKHGKAQNTGEHGNPPNTAHRIEQHTRRDRAHAHCTESSTRCIERTNDHHVRDTDRARESKYRKQTEHSNKQLAETHKGAHRVRINGTQGYTERVEKSVRMIHITQHDTGTDRRNMAQEMGIQSARVNSTQNGQHVKLYEAQASSRHREE